MYYPARMGELEQEWRLKSMVNNNKRYMKFAESSGCILADYYSAGDIDNSILAVNNSFESGVINYPRMNQNLTYEQRDCQCSKNN